MPPRRRPAPPVAPRGVVALVVTALACGAAAPAADLPPEVVARFTRGVQPLLLNRCASGACHGGADAPAPKFRRPPGSAGPDRSMTMANLAAFLAAVGTDRDAARLAATLAAGHPRGAQAARRVAPLTARERATLDSWLAAAHAGERRPRRDTAVLPAGAVEPAATPNRFRALLDDAANPPQFPPPEEPKGVIFKNDPPAE